MNEVKVLTPIIPSIYLRIMELIKEDETASQELKDGTK